jgi:hypothetical protein
MTCSVSQHAEEDTHVNKRRRNFICDSEDTYTSMVSIEACCELVEPVVGVEQVEFAHHKTVHTRFGTALPFRLGKRRRTGGYT